MQPDTGRKPALQDAVQEQSPSKEKPPPGAGKNGAYRVDLLPLDFWQKEIQHIAETWFKFLEWIFLYGVLRYASVRIGSTWLNALAVASWLLLLAYITTISFRVRFFRDRRRIGWREVIYSTILASVVVFPLTFTIEWGIKAVDPSLSAVPVRPPHAELGKTGPEAKEFASPD
jgi:hypothetical protein